MSGSLEISLTASSLIKGIDDVSILKYAGQVSGVVIGRALFNQTVDSKDALALAAAQVEKVAEFI